MRTLYFDCFAGASGNMILGALLGLGVEIAELEREIAKLSLPGVLLKVTKVDRSGISAVHVEVKSSDEKDHRHLSYIERIIDGSGLSDSVMSRSKAIFRRLAEAEAKIHGIDIDHVHFHEVGAVDAIVDVVGACVGFEKLGIERFVCSKINVGSGFVQMEHGRYPVPPPAVSELLQGLPVFSNEIEGELITPTGAAIISTVCEAYGHLPEMELEVSSYGAGTRTYEDFPNVLRLLMGNSVPESPNVSMDTLLLIETNLDDVSPQILGYVMEQALDVGALDVWFTPIQMKKNRPATMISVLCPKDSRATITELLYRETTTLGLRVREVTRECLPREIVTVTTRFGVVDVKLARFGGKVINAMPEYEQVRKLATANQVSFREIQSEVLARLQEISIASTA
jgi:uncharacterized protein (TIGR00299 family) protein